MAGVNRLLAALPPDEYQRLQTRLQEVALPKDQVLYDVGEVMRYAYFPLGGALSLLAPTPDGPTVEVAMVGYEGMIGLQLVLHASTAPYQVMVQIPGRAYQVPADILKTEFTCSPGLHDLLLRYAHSRIVQVSQSVVCHRFHTVSQRLCRCLLDARDRTDSDVLLLTQESIARMLSIPRPRITSAAVILQDAGMIHCRHGKITILDGRQLETAACECYRIVRDALGPSSPTDRVTT